MMTTVITELPTSAMSYSGKHMVTKVLQDVWPVGRNIFCGVKKLVEFDDLSQVLMVLHLGTHICTLKPQTEDDAYLLDVTSSDMQQGLVALRRNEVKKLVKERNIRDAHFAAKKLTNE